ncbi:hypothetical protein A0H81_06131 [Grifola frondosa]|uniref:Protein kinase domain-containing protein n=1 Tax=Grifola frondosa TaxID=5627 RepID=A0A1C7MA55_GRIFR|nr:hypothetical protein A0H81_06131 [Grifola frondosa]
MQTKFRRSKHLPPNALASAVVSGLVKTNDGAEVDVCADTCTPPPIAVKHQPAKWWRRRGGMPKRKLPKLPTPKYLRLELKVGEKLGEGRCGSVYAPTVVRLFDPANPVDSLDYPKAPILPELVIKVAEPHQRWRLKREASAYEEMQVLQGISVARCYGWFEAKLADGCSVPGHEDDDDDYSYSTDEDDPDCRIRQEEPLDVLSFLVLERLGGFLTMGKDYYKETDIYEVYEDLGVLGITHDDVRYRNLVLAAPSPPGFENRFCPYHKHPHQYRVIDFDKSFKTDTTVEHNFGMSRYAVRRVFEGIKGYFEMAPW